ncbi:hypothetical protein H9P43_007977 [Blastocladiella emersonii ATCC 22665]|nr:hypothetical protein H9P43_007977 [Blastocladiella emersonii ATCC 22665]
MGKAKKVGGRRVAQRGSGPAAPAAAAPAAPQPPQDLDALFAQALAHYEQSDLDSAMPLLQTILGVNGDHLPALELAGAAMMDQGEPEAALACFSRYYAQCQTNEAVVLYLGQLAGAKQAVEYFTLAVRIMEGKLAAGVDAETRVELVNKTVEALCSIAEIYLTDLCFEPDAAETCLSVLHRAIALDASNPNPYLTLTSVQISNSQPADAKATMQRGLDLWVAPFMSYMQALADPDRAHEVENTPPPHLPPYESRLNAARLCLELGMWGRAIDVLGICAQEFDEAVDLWYLFGWAYFLFGEVAGEPGPATAEVAGVKLAVEFPDDEVMEARSSRAEWWTEAIDCLHRAKGIYVQEKHDDPPLLAHVEELLARIAADGVFGDADDEDGAGAAGEGEWEDMEM